MFHAIADPTRRSILIMLAEKEMSIAAIASCFPVSRTAVNKHLKVLCQAGLAASEKTGRETVYSLKPQPLEELKNWLQFFEVYWDNKLLALKKFTENNNG
ncbi:ArsR/SmtB family transcription factor [Actinomycetes bacterium NPDC127524]